MKLSSYLKDKIFSIIASIIVVSLISALLISLNAHILLIIYIPIILIISYIIVLIHDYILRYHFYHTFDHIINKLDKKYLITEIMNHATFTEGELMTDYLYEINKAYIEEINKHKFANEDFKEYIELWCHEIKTPIATSKLIIDNNKNNITSNILEEVDKVDDLVEQVLYYARSENVDKDYIIDKVNLKVILQSVIRRNKKDILQKKIKVNCFDDDVYVESDAKWLEFIINQIITNGVKYSKNNKPEIIMTYQTNKNNTLLYIEDNGIGIKNDEVSKVFNKGFTGTNGRQDHSRATGMGLYLCKKLCNKLGHNIGLSSILNEKTIVTLVFPNNSMINNVK